MRRFHYSTRGVLIAVMVIAAALGALRANSEIVTGLAMALYAGLLCLAVVGGLVCRGDRRVFWVGFAVFGWAYAIMVFWADPIQGYSSNRITIRSPLPTARLLEWFAGLRSSYAVGSRVMAQWRGGGWYSSTIVEYDSESGLYRVQWDDGSPAEWVNSQQIQYGTGAGIRGGHAILGPLIAAIGGLISGWCFGSHPDSRCRNDDRRTDPPVRSGIQPPDA